MKTQYKDTALQTYTIASLERNVIALVNVNPWIAKLLIFMKIFLANFDTLIGHCKDDNN